MQKFQGDLLLDLIPEKQTLIEELARLVGLEPSPAAPLAGAGAGAPWRSRPGDGSIKALVQDPAPQRLLLQRTLQDILHQNERNALFICESLGHVQELLQLFFPSTYTTQAKKELNAPHVHTKGFAVNREI